MIRVLCFLNCVEVAFFIFGLPSKSDYLSIRLSHYLAVPSAIYGAFGTSVGGIAKYVSMGYQPDWIMAALISGGAMCGGMLGPEIQKKLPDIFLKRMLAGP